MPVTIKQKAPASAPAKAYPREGVHLRATPWERSTAHKYTGSDTGPLCDAGEKSEATYLARKVTCPCCIALIADKLRLPEYLTLQQWAIIEREPMPGAPDEDKGEEYPNPLPHRDAYGRMGRQITKPATGPQKRPQEATPKPRRAKAAKTGQATPKAADAPYDDF